MASEASGASRGRPAARSEAAFARLRADLLDGGPLTARRRLVTGELARQLGVSRTPVREALDRLARLGYLTRLEGGGYERRRFRTRDVRDLYELRLLLEPFAAALSAQGHQGDLDDADASPYHLRVAHASGNRVLAHVIDLINERDSALRVDPTRDGPRGGHRPIDRDACPAHKRITEAIRAGDVEAARATMAQHLAAEGRMLARSAGRGAAPR